MSYQIRLAVMEVARLSACNSELPRFIAAHLWIASNYKDTWYSQFNPRDTRYAYSRELEYMGVDMRRFLLGMVLRTDDSAAGGNSRSASKAASLLYESSQPRVIEEAFERAALDKSLDLHNRVTCYQVLANYYKIRYRRDDIAIDDRKLEKIAATMPAWAIKNRE